MSSDQQSQNDSSCSDADHDDTTIACLISPHNIDPDVDKKSSRISSLKCDDEELFDGLRDSESKDEEERGSNGDICRICHMGGFPRMDETADCENARMQGADSEASNLSSYAYLGPLISACKCRGTVALVHAECLERWLTESGHTRCELCGHKYATRRVPRHNILRSLVLWVNTVIATRQMLLDILYLVVTTPLAIFSCYICIVAMRLLMKSGIHDVPWMIVAILPTCFLTLAAYWGWLITLGRLHGRRWRRYWRSNFVIQLLPENVNTLETTDSEQGREARPEGGWRNFEDAAEFMELF